MKYTTKTIPRQSGIYYIRHIESGKIYIGSSINCNARMNHHKHELIFDKHANKHLQNSFNKYHIDSFECGVIEYCSTDMLFEREQAYYDFHKQNSFNLRDVVHSNMGIKYPPMSEETKAKLRNPSDETRQRMRDSHIGYAKSEETRLKISRGNKGKTSYNIEAATLAKQKALVEVDTNNNILRRWDSMKDCMSELDICQPSLYRILSKTSKKYRHMNIKYA